MNNFLSNFMPDFIMSFSPLDIVTISVSAILWLSAMPICRWLHPDNIVGRVSVMRLLNFLVILAVLAKGFFWHDNALLSKVTQCLILVYFSLFFMQIVNFFILRRFGKKHKSSNDKETFSDTYSSRGLSIFFSAFVAIMAIITCLKIFGLNSIFEAGGTLGIIGFFLAMTQGSWAPDIINGLIILNSRQCEEGDVIQFNMDGDVVVASVFKTKLFNTHCLDIANNHRMIIGNAKLRNFGIQNLSRFASAKGLRECLLFNIDYKHSQVEVEDMINRAFEQVDAAENIREEQFAPEIRVHDTGDYAVTWAVYYYIKDVKKLLSIRQYIRAYILAESVKSNISLATPVLQQSCVSIENLDASIISNQNAN